MNCFICFVSFCLLFFFSSVCIFSGFLFCLLFLVFCLPFHLLNSSKILFMVYFHSAFLFSPYLTQISLVSFFSNIFWLFFLFYSLSSFYCSIPLSPFNFALFYLLPASEGLLISTFLFCHLSLATFFSTIFRWLLSFLLSFVGCLLFYTIFRLLLSLRF